MNIRLWVLLLLSLTPLLSGCISGERKSNALDGTLYRYQSAMRWGYWDSLAGFRHKKAPPMPALDLDNVQVTTYEVKMRPVQLDETTVAQTVEIEYVLKDEQKLRRVRDEQLWRYDEEAGEWLLHSPFPGLR